MIFYTRGDTVTVIVCVDDRLGTMFNGRRQSKDRLLRERVICNASNGFLVMSPYTERQFADDDVDNKIVSDTPLESAQSGDFCFVEGNNLSEHLDKIKRIILYKWNRTYPYDQTLDVDLSSWVLKGSCDFEGSSHEKITEEVYERA